MASHPDWNESYAAGDPPWDTGEPDEHLMQFVGAGLIAPGRALDIGCGTGTNAVWLSTQGFTVLGVDVASIAIDRARARAAGRKAACRFETRDFLHEEVDGAPFDFVFDLGCFHVFDEAADRARFAARVAALLAPDGRWLSLAGSTEGPDRDWGPPRRSALDVAGAIDPALEILELRAVEFRIPQLPASVAAWWCVSRRRAGQRSPR